MAIAVPVKRRRPSALWLITAACAALSAWLIFNAYRNQGDLIEIEFEQGHGLQPADALRFRGIEIGRVEKIDLRPHPPGVLAAVRLTANARSVLTEGTRFWIVRPVVSFESIQGLETVIGPKYIAIEPGKGDAAKTRRFVGLESPPPIQPREGSMEIVLDSKRRHGLASGAPVLHRGFRVGDVLSVDLASDARSVILRAAIDPEYHELIRSNSKFWVRSGWRLDLGLGGVRVDADSLSEILYGGIEFATPDAQGAIASNGSRFELFEEPKDEWLDWQPSLPFGAQWESVHKQSLRSPRIALRWKEKSFGFTVDRQRRGWGLILDDGCLVCRDDMGSRPQQALDATANIELLGSVQPWVQPIAEGGLSDGHRLVKIPLAAKDLEAASRFRSEKVLLSPISSAESATAIRAVPSQPKPLDAPVDVMVVGPEPAKGLVLDAGRLTPTARGWQIDSRIFVAPDWDSALVVEVSSGRCIGCLNVQRGAAVIAILQTTE